MIPVLIAGLAAGVLIANTASNEPAEDSKETKTRKPVDKVPDRIKQKMESQELTSEKSSDTESNSMELNPYQVVLSTIKDLKLLHASHAAYRNAVAELESDENIQYFGAIFQISRLDSKNCRCIYELYFNEFDEFQVCTLQSKVFSINRLEKSVQDALPEGKTIMFSLNSD